METFYKKISLCDYYVYFWFSVIFVNLEQHVIKEKEHKKIALEEEAAVRKE